MATTALIGALRVDLSMSSAAFLRAAGEAERALAHMNKRMAAVSANLRAAGARLGLAVSTPIIGGFAAVVRSSGDFEQAMNRVSALSGATGAEFAQLKSVAQELGATTKFSASEAADAMGFLAMAGFKTNEIIGAMPSTLQLAAASGADLATSADIVSNILTGFGKKVEDLAEVNDVLVKAMTSSNTDLRMLGDAMKYVGPVASSAKLRFNEVTAALGMLGNAGIQGEMGGTALRGAITRLLAPTSAVVDVINDLGLDLYKSNGQLKDLADIVRELEPHADNTGAMMELFGQRAGPAMAALVAQGADELERFEAQLDAAGGTAARIAETQMQGFNGAMTSLKSALEGLAIAIGESGLLEFATGLTSRLTEVVRTLSQTNPEMLRMGTMIAAAAAAIGPLLGGLGIAVAVIGALATPIGAAVLALSALAAGVAWLAYNWDDLATRYPILQQGLAAARAGFEVLGEAVQIVAQNVMGALDLVSALLRGDFAGAWEAAVGIVQRTVDGMLLILGDLPERVGEIFADLGALIGEMLAELGRDMREWGGNLVDGLVSGLRDQWRSAKTAVKDFGKSVGDWFTEETEIHSPSRLFKRYGGYIVEGLALGIDGAASQAEQAVVSLGERLKRAGADAVSSFTDTMADGLAQGDLGGALQGAFSGLLRDGKSAFSDVLKDAFSGGGFGAITSSISGAWAGVKAALSGGLSFGAIGSAVSAALPIVGLVSSVLGLVRGFSSKKLTGAGLQFDLSGGAFSGGTYETWKKKSFWGLVSNTRTYVTAFDADTQAALEAQVAAVQAAVAATYKAAGVAIEEGFVEGFDYDFGKIATKGLSEAEVADAIAEAFEGYGDAISEAIGGVGLELAATFATVRNMLAPVGQLFYGPFAEMAKAADDLATRFGGTSALASSVSGFVRSYFSEAEQIAMIRESVSGVFADLGLAMPKTLAGFRELALAQDLMTETGRAAYAALLGVADQFAQITNAVGNRFDLSDGWFVSEYEARLAQVANARGYGIVTDVATNSGVTQYGRSTLSGDTAAVQILNRIAGLFESWDAEGMPSERSF